MEYVRGEGRGCGMWGVSPPFILSGLGCACFLRYKTLLCGPGGELLFISQNPSWHCSFSWMASTHYERGSLLGPWRWDWPTLQEVGLVASFFSFGRTPRGMWDLSSPTRDRTHTPCRGSAES